MNEDPCPAPESAAVPVRIGQQLAQARERCGLSVGDVARQLKLSSGQVEAMETGDYQRLPGAVFVRGFIRNYARLINLDPGPLLANAEQQLRIANFPANELPGPINIPFPTSRNVPWHNYAIAGLIVAALLAAYEYYGDKVDEAVIAARPVLPAQPETMAAVQNPDGGGTPQVVLAGDVESGSAREPETVQITSPSTEKPAASAGATQSPDAPREHQLRLKFERKSWVEIRDRNGRRIFSQMNSPGTEQAVSGLPPLSVVVGNAVGVRLTYNDQPVDLIPYIKVDVARLTLE